jgi:hypothetical protein
VPGGNPEVDGRLREWFERESGDVPAGAEGWRPWRCLATLAWAPGTGQLSVSAVSVERDLKAVQVFVDSNPDANGAPNWDRIGVIKGRGRAIAGTLLLPLERFHGGECRLSTQLTFIGGTEMFGYEQPVHVIRLAGAPSPG